MSEVPRVTRRRITAGIAGLVGLATFPVFSIMARRNAVPSTQDIAASLASIFLQEDGTQNIGKGYLSMRPKEADPDLLVHHILADDPKARTSFCCWPKVLQRAYIARRCRQEFATGRTVVVNNWILSETEARLSALAALLST